MARFSCHEPGPRVTGIKDSKGAIIVTKLYAFVQSFAAVARDAERGQTMAEYAVVLAVVTIAIITALGLLAGGIESTLSSVTSTL
jgi:Flp pilus assembly pilin Flp